MLAGGVRDEADPDTVGRTSAHSQARSSRVSRKPAPTTRSLWRTRSGRLGADYRGDPAQGSWRSSTQKENDTCSLNHCLDVPFDLSKVLFIATANQMHPIPGLLRDRMEVPEIPGYTMDEKLKISRSYIIPEVLEDHGRRRIHGDERRGHPLPDRVLHSGGRCADARA